MYVAQWNNQTIASSDSCQLVEGNVYFPHSAVNQSFLKPSDHTTRCGWKGTANYYTLVVDGKENVNAAWYYKTPLEKAKNIEGHVAFWKGVQVTQK
jgi:uncharacterized protein (DUF427 family)